MVKSVPAPLLSLIFLTLMSFTGIGESALARARNRAELNSCITNLIPGEALFEKVKSVHERSVLLTGQSLPGFHGGRLLIVTKNEFLDSWYSTYQIYPAAGQGDPRMLVALLGSELAHFFGIRQISDSEITIPDITELNGAIKALNQALVELGYKPIPLTFFPQGEEQHNARTYVENFTHRHMLPYANHIVLKIHDVALHISSIAIPETMFEPIHRRYDLALRFYDYAKTQARPRFFAALDDQYFHHLDRSLDLGTGGISVAYMVRAQYWRDDESAAIDKAKNILKKSMGAWLHSAEDQKTFMQNMLSEVFRGGMLNLNAKVNNLYFQHLLNNFLQDPQVARTLAEPALFKPEQTYDLIENRVLELKAAYNLLKSRGVAP